MTKEEFIRRMDEIEARLEEFRGRRSWTYGLCTHSKEGYKTRLKYLAKFKAYSLRFWRYRRY